MKFKSAGGFIIKNIEMSKDNEFLSGSNEIECKGILAKKHNVKQLLASSFEIESRHNANWNTCIGLVDGMKVTVRKGGWCPECGHLDWELETKQGTFCSRCGHGLMQRLTVFSSTKTTKRRSKNNKIIKGLP